MKGLIITEAGIGLSSLVARYSKTTRASVFSRFDLTHQIKYTENPVRCDTVRCKASEDADTSIITNLFAERTIMRVFWKILHWQVEGSKIGDVKY